MSDLVTLDPVVFSSSPQQRVEELIAVVGSLLVGLIAQLRAGQITAEQFIERATVEIRDHAQEAAALAGGSPTGVAAVDALIEDRAQYLPGLADDTESEAASDAQLAARAALWGGLMHTAYQMAQVHEADQQTGAGEVIAITWACQDDESSCEQCPSIADGSPYTLDSLPTFPGADVRCGGNCRCVLQWDTVPADEVDFSRTVHGPFLPLAEPHTARGGVYVLAGGGR